MQKKICLQEAIRVVRVKDDAEWRDEYALYGYAAEAEYMWTAHGELEETWAEDMYTTEVYEDATYGFMCGNSTNRRLYGFEVDVYKGQDGNYWVSSEDYATIG